MKMNNQNKVNLVKDILAKAKKEINEARNKRDEDIKKILKNIDKRQEKKILDEIKNTK